MLPIIFFAWAVYFIVSYLHASVSRRAAYILEDDPVVLMVSHVQVRCRICHLLAGSVSSPFLRSLCEPLEMLSQLVACSAHAVTSHCLCWCPARRTGARQEEVEPCEGCGTGAAGAPHGGGSLAAPQAARQPVRHAQIVHVCHSIPSLFTCMPALHLCCNALASLAR